MLSPLLILIDSVLTYMVLPCNAFVLAKRSFKRKKTLKQPLYDSHMYSTCCAAEIWRTVTLQTFNTILITQTYLALLDIGGENCVLLGH